MASRLSDKDLARWRDRLRYAKHVYERMGIIGTRFSTMRMLIEFYRGHHWEHLSDSVFSSVGEDDRAKVNKTFSVANRILAGVAARNPRVQLFPRNQDSVRIAPAAEALVNYDIQEMHMVRPLNRALADHLFAPVGIIRHGFTPEEELFDENGRRLTTFQPANPDKPWIRREPLWNVLMDPDAVSWHPDGDGWWVMFRSLFTMEQIRRNPNMKNRKDLRPHVSSEYRKMQPGVLRDGGAANPDENDKVEIWTVFEAKERTWFQMTADGESKPIRDLSEWPLDWEWLPINVLGINEQMDTPFPVPILEQMVDRQLALNKLETMMDILTRELRRLVFVNKGVAGEQYDTIVSGETLQEFFGIEGDLDNAVKEVQIGGFPAELIARRRLLEEDIRELSGESQMDLAQRINVESAQEAAQVQAGSDISASRLQGHYERFNRDVVRMYMQGRKQTTTQQELVPILGPDDAGRLGRQWVTVNPRDLHGEFDFEVVVGSTLPKDRDREAQRALADMEVAKAFPNIFDLAKAGKRYAEARALDPEDVLRPEALAAATAESVMQSTREGDGAPPPNQQAAAQALQGPVPSIDPALLGGLGGGG